MLIGIPGLVPPAAAVFLMGKSGAILIVTMLFMAVTSAGSAELVAVSSLCTYDIYKTYINPKATGTLLLYLTCANHSCTTHHQKSMDMRVDTRVGLMFLSYCRVERCPRKLSMRAHPDTSRQQLCQNELEPMSD